MTSAANEESERREVSCRAPFIFIATRLKPGEFGNERARVPGLVDFAEANEPQLLAFNE
jgi:hypothetical protein